MSDVDDLVTWLRAQLAGERSDPLMQDVDLRMLALRYADRPGYREEWAPDLVTWLRAQLDEDERRAPRAAEVMRLRPSTAPFADGLLREVEAKRRIVTRYEFAYDQAETARVNGWTGEQVSWEKIAGALKLCVRDHAAPYADRPGYRDEWRP